MLIRYEGSTFNDRRWLHQDERGSVSAISKLPVGGFLGDAESFANYYLGNSDWATADPSLGGGAGESA